MKKTIKYMGVALCALALVACSNVPMDQPNDEVLKEEMNPSPKEEAKEYFGLVSSVAGNEVELELASLPTDKSDGNESSTGGGTEGEVAVGGGEMAGSEETAKDSATETSKKLSEMIEYSGETKAFILPTGIEISSLVGGKGDLSLIRKGSVIMVKVDEAGSVIACEIWE